MVDPVYAAKSLLKFTSQIKITVRDLLQEMAVLIGLHSVEGVRDCFSSRVHSNNLFKGEPMVYELISKYSVSGNLPKKGSGFKEGLCSQ